MTSRPSGAAGLPETGLADRLREEAVRLGRQLGHPVLTVHGAAGVLNPTARPVVSVFQTVDQHALLRAVEVLPYRPQLLVLEGVQVDVVDLEQRGWRSDQDGVTDCSAPADLPWPVLDDVHVVTEDDLADVRHVLDRAFGDESSADYLPPGVTAVRGLRLLLHRPAGRPLAVIGVRVREEGALLFGLGVVPEARRRGLALALVGAAAREVRRAGRGTVQVQAEGPSLEFWSAAGFEQGARWRSFTPAT